MKRLTHEEFVCRAVEVHGNKYTYNNKYYSMHHQIRITCNIHGEFFQEPSEHLKGYGCNRYAIDSRTKSRSQFKQEATTIHGKRYGYGKYTSCANKMAIRCYKHGWFYQTPNKHLRGHGCPKCSKKMYSERAVRWLESISANIVHGKNGGEYILPELNIHVDGFDKETNTVYEFHGDRFHGNPKMFNSEENCHPYNLTITANELYQKTTERDESIRSVGYNLIVMWEHDFLNGVQ